VIDWPLSIPGEGGVTAPATRMGLTETKSVEDDWVEEDASVTV